MKHRKSYRLKDWDYSSEAAYFVTLAVAERVHAFGEIVEEKLLPTELGKQAIINWNMIPKFHPYVRLGPFVVMLDHIHGIIMINRDQEDPVPKENQFGAQIRNLPLIVRGYKQSITKFAKSIELPFSWVSRYHDRVIRSQEEYDNVSLYIQENPARWQEKVKLKIPQTLF